MFDYFFIVKGCKIPNLIIIYLSLIYVRFFGFKFILIVNQLVFDSVIKSNYVQYLVFPFYLARSFIITKILI